MAGEIVACELVKLACRRHLRDLEEGGGRGLHWSAEAAQFRIGFYPRFLRHSKGEWARKPVELSLFQKFIIGSVFGWKRADGTRRFRYVYLELPRKSGKSTLLAGLGLDMLLCDDEPGAEIYCVATKKEQARIIFDEAKRMVASSPDLANEIDRFKLNMSVDRTASKFEPLSSDEKTLDGLNPHCVLIDELHKHKTRAVLDVMDTAVGARRQPMICIITTAGDDNPGSVYAQENGLAVNILQGSLQNDSVFAFISTIDKGDRWDDPVAWAKANPALGVSVKLDDLERLAEKAKGSPAALNAFKRLRLNVRTSDVERVIDMPRWAENSSGAWDPDKLPKGMRCWAGIDLSTRVDLTAWVKLFEPDERGVMKVAARFWIPAECIDKRAEKYHGAQYRDWIRDGWIDATEGDVIDHEDIFRTVMADAKRFDIQSIAFDPWSQSQMGIKLNEQGVESVEFIQGIRSYTEPTKEFQALIAQRKLDHGDNPVLTWMASNLAVQRDKNLNEMPHKAHSTARIDGITALIMAIGRHMSADAVPQSIYDDPTAWGDQNVAIQPRT